MSKNTIRVDGEKVKRALETITCKTVYQISVENGFSDNFLKQACKANRASPIVQSVMRSYGLDPEDFKLKEEPELKQMTIEDMQSERLNKALDQSAKAFDKLGGAVFKYKSEIEVAFTKLKEEWIKAIDEYNESIKRLKEGR
jgi:hypothetical protein